MVCTNVYFQIIVISDDGPPYIPDRRLIHFDLKGAPPKVTYLIEVLKLSKNLGATGVLVEWEDMFPFAGNLASASATNHYNLSDVNTLLDTCRQLDLEVIPLVQTFGHMEFILKLEEFSHLRDVPEMPESICPCHQVWLLQHLFYVGLRSCRVTRRYLSGN